MVKRTDVILSVGMLVLVLLALALMVATGSTGEFVAWAWGRHHNVLSWYIRPLFFLPFCFFAYKRSLSGMIVTLVALATSMFWFPAPERTDPNTAGCADIDPCRTPCICERLSTPSEEGYARIMLRGSTTLKTAVRSSSWPTYP